MTAITPPELRALATALIDIDRLNRKIASARGAGLDSAPDSAQRDDLHQVNDGRIRTLATSLVAEDLEAAHKMMALLSEDSANKAREILQVAEGSLSSELFGSSAGSRMGFVLEPLSSPGTSASVLNDLNLQQAQLNARAFVDSLNYELARVAIIRKGVETVVTDRLRSKLESFDPPLKRGLSRLRSRATAEAQGRDHRRVEIVDGRGFEFEPLAVLELKNLTYIVANWVGASYPKRGVDLGGVNVLDEPRQLWQTVKGAERMWVARMETVIDHAHQEVVVDFQRAIQGRAEATEISGSIANAVVADRTPDLEVTEPHANTVRTQSRSRSREIDKSEILGL